MQFIANIRNRELTNPASIKRHILTGGIIGYATRNAGVTLLYRLCYISTKTRLADLAAIPELLLKSRQNNETAELTGLLLSADVSFLQVLEGSHSSIQERFSVIENDTRHCWIVQLRFEPIGKRLFHHPMAMHECKPGDEITGLIQSIASLDHLGQMPSNRATDLDRVIETFSHPKFDTAA